MNESKMGLKTGVIFSGPAWRLWMILNHPTLKLVEDYHRQLIKLKNIWSNKEIQDHQDPSHIDQ